MLTTIGILFGALALAPLDSESFGILRQHQLQGDFGGRHYELSIAEALKAPFDNLIQEVYGRPLLNTAIAVLKISSPGQTLKKISLIGEHSDEGFSFRSDSLADVIALARSPKATDRYKSPYLIFEFGTERVSIFGLEKWGIQSVSKDIRLDEKASTGHSELEEFQSFFGSMKDATPEPSTFDVRFLTWESQNLGIYSLSFDFKRRAWDRRNLLLEGSSIDLKKFIRLMKAVETIHLPLEKITLEELVEKDAKLDLALRNLSIESFSEEVSAKRLLQLGLHFFGNWRDAVSGTCARSKLVHTPVMSFPKVGSRIWTGYRYGKDGQNQNVSVRPLYFEMLPASKPGAWRIDTRLQASQDFNQGWPSSLELKSLSE